MPVPLALAHLDLTNATVQPVPEGAGAAVVLLDDIQKRANAVRAQGTSFPNRQSIPLQLDESPPGGFQDDLGAPARQPHPVAEPGPPSRPRHTNSHRRAPIKIRYRGLDPEARYKVRVPPVRRAERGIPIEAAAEVRLIKR